jgi:hypothetical protein
VNCERAPARTCKRGYGRRAGPPFEGDGKRLLPRRIHLNLIREAIENRDADLRGRTLIGSWTSRICPDGTGRMGPCGPILPDPY